jgi:2-polyprenyl-3-methyl-5-hydroxy-6-metoxy-1,4-benzoquinol methylase
MNPAQTDLPSFARYVAKPHLGSSHWWATEQLKSLPPLTRILDIGSGSGVIGATLKEHRFSELYAVENDPPTVTETAPLYARIEVDIAAYRTERFDAILLLDILEHVEDPRDLLLKAVDLLSPTGCLLISVPNTAHWSVRIPLALGFFHRSHRGILDRTHRHFFTRARLLELLAEIPHELAVELRGSIAPAELVLPRALTASCLYRALSAARLRIAQWFPEFAAYQHLARVTIKTVP